MFRVLASLAIALPLLSTTSCALSTTPGEEAEAPDTPPMPPSETGCAFVDSPMGSEAELFSFLGTELHAFDSSGGSTALVRFTGEGTEAVRAGDTSFSPNGIAANGDFILVTTSWYAPTYGSSQEAVLLHRTEGLVWRRVHEGDAAIFGAVVGTDGFVFGNRYLDGRPAQGSWIGPDGSQGMFSGAVVGIPYPNGTLLTRHCDSVGCGDYWSRDGYLSNTLPNASGTYRFGEEVLRLRAFVPQMELWLEGPDPETRRHVPIPAEFRTFEIVSFDPAGWVLVQLDPTTAPGHFLRVNLITGAVDSLSDWAGELLSVPALHSLGKVSALFRQDGDVILANDTFDAGWSQVGDVLPADYDVVHFGRSRGQTIMVAHQIPTQFNHVTDLLNAETGARFDVSSAASGQLTQNGLCFAAWWEGDDGGATLEVLSLATGETRSLAAGDDAQVLWVND